MLELINNTLRLRCGENPRFKVLSAHPHLALFVLRIKIRLEVADRSILPDQLPPVARLSSWSQISIPERLDGVVRNPLRRFGVINEILHLAVQIGKLAVHLDEIGLWAGWQARRGALLARLKGGRSRPSGSS